MSEFLKWSHKVTDIPSAGLEREREADEAERQAVAAALGLLELRRLQAAYRIEHAAGGAYRLRGRLAADLDQACVITLEPVTDRIETPFDVEFWPQLEAPDAEDEASVLSGPDVELLEAGTIPVGRIVFETLAASLDPYPRRENAEFTWQDPRAAEPEKVSPFAVLSKLKDAK